MKEFYDKYGRKIEEFDVLRVFHFVGRRRQRHYMYKGIEKVDGKLVGNHLDGGGHFDLRCLSREDVEIVQSNNWEKLDKKNKNFTDSDSESRKEKE